MMHRIDKHDIPARRGDPVKDIRDFLAAEWNAAEVDVTKYKDAHSALKTYNQTAKRIGASVHAITRRGRVFLVKED